MAKRTSQRSSRTPPEPISASGPPDDFIYPFHNSTLCEYYRQLFDWHGYIKFLSLPHFRENPDIPIWDLFVEPSLSAAHIRADRWKEQDGEHTFSVLDALKKRRQLVILGDPGSGKSTIVNWLIWQFTRVESNPLVEAFGRRVPVPLIVRDLGISSKWTWADLLEKFFERPASQPFARDPKLFEDLLRRGQLIFLLDGMDELSNVHVRQHLASLVVDGIKESPKAMWIATSRLVGYDEAPLEFDTGAFVKTPREQREAFLGPELGRDKLTDKLIVSYRIETAYVAPFSDRQVAQYLEAWFRVRDSAGEQASDNASRLAAAIRKNESVARLARVPQFLALIALIFRILRELPHGKVLLYDRITEAYLESIDKFRNLQELDYPLAQKKRWLAYIGFQMQLQRDVQDRKGRTVEEHEILVEEKTIVSWLAEAMGQSDQDQDLPERELRGRAKEYLSFLARRSGLILPRGQDKRGELYAFQHLSFQEYFAAEYLRYQTLRPGWHDGKHVEGAGPKDLARYAGNPQWCETLLFLLEMCHELPERGDELIQILQRVPKELKKESKNDEQPHRAASLLSLLTQAAVDPYVGLTKEGRRNLLRTCWEQVLEMQDSDLAFLWSSGEAVTTLAEAGETSRRIGTEVLRSQRPQRMSLAGASLDTLAWVLPVFGSSGDARQLMLQECVELSDLEFLGKLSNLQYLSLSGCTGLTEVGALGKLSNLQYLNLSGCTRLTEVGALGKLSNLQYLSLSGCTGLTEVGALGKLSNLQYLYLSGCTGLTDLSPVEHVKKLVRP